MTTGLLVICAARERVFEIVSDFFLVIELASNDQSYLYFDLITALDLDRGECGNACRVSGSRFQVGGEFSIPCPSVTFRQLPRTLLLVRKPRLWESIAMEDRTIR